MSPWRRMLPADLPAVDALGTAIHTAHPERAAIAAERLALAPETCFVLATPEIQGYLVAHPWAGDPPKLDTLLGTLPAQPDHLYLHDLALAPAARGQRHPAGILPLLPNPIALISVNGTAPFWQAHGFRPAPIAPAKLASYGPGAVYMRR